MDVDTAVRIAVINNPGLQATLLGLGVSRAELVQSTLFTNPSITFGMQFPDGGGPTKLVAGFSQQVADLWEIPVKKRIAEAELERTLLDAARRGVELVADVRGRCYRLLALQQLEATLRKGRALAEQAERLAGAQLAAGEVSALDVRLARAARVDVDLALLRSERDRSTAEIELAQTLGLSRAPANWTLAGTLPDPPPALPDDAELIAAALEQRFDARAATFAVQAAQDELTRQRLRVFSDLTLGADFERPDRRSLPSRKVLADAARSSIAAGRLSAPSLQSRGERRLEMAQVIDALLGPTVTVTLPLWDQNQAQIARAGFIVAQRRIGLEERLDAIAAEVMTAAAAARSAISLLRTYEDEAVPQAEENVADALRLYEQGEQGILVVLDAQESLLDRQRGCIEARRDCAIAVAELEKALAGRVDALQTNSTTTQPASDEPAEEQ